MVIFTSSSNYKDLSLFKINDNNETELIAKLDTENIYDSTRLRETQIITLYDNCMYISHSKHNWGNIDYSGGTTYKINLSTKEVTTIMLTYPRSTQSNWMYFYTYKDNMFLLYDGYRGYSSLYKIENNQYTVVTEVKYPTTGSSKIGYRFQKPSSTSYTISRVVCNDNNYGFVNTKVDNINAAGITPNFEYIFIDGNLYNLNENNTKGSLVKSNIYQVTGNNNIFRWITDQYLIYNNRLYKWDYEELTLTDVGTAYSYSGDIADTPTGYYVCVEGSFITDNLTKVIFPIKSSFMIGFYYNNVLYTSKDISVISDQNVLDGYIGYNAGLQKIVGTMPNNGQLNYTPSTLPQTIPAGYTSGGTIEAVTMSEEDIENAIAQAEDILD